MSGLGGAILEKHFRIGAHILKLQPDQMTGLTSCSQGSMQHAWLTDQISHHNLCLPTGRATQVLWFSCYA